MSSAVRQGYIQRTFQYERATRLAQVFLSWRHFCQSAYGILYVEYQSRKTFLLDPLRGAHMELYAIYRRQQPQIFLSIE